MNARLIPLAVLVALVGANTATLVLQAEPDQPAESLPFMTATRWQRSPPDHKLALATDFMRVFCVQQAMSPARLSNCLDTEIRDGTPFDSAIACIKKLAEADN
jgi:hypothetical protein